MQIHSLFQLFEEFVRLEGPILALEELRVLADEHLGGLLVALQLPLEPSKGGNGELATVRLTISASVPYWEVDGTAGNMLDALEVVHTIAVGDILRTTEHIHDRCVDFVEFLLLRHRHTTDSLTGILLVEKSAIANHEGLDAWVSTVEERLQTTARHTCDTDSLGVNLLIVGRIGVVVLGNHPVDTLYLLVGT